MIKLKKFVAVALSTVLTTAALTGCTSSKDDSSASTEGEGSVYYLNFKPESEELWLKVAEDYVKETGV